MTLPGTVVAHHAAFVAIPVVAPALIVSAIFVVLIWRDRRAERREQDDRPGKVE